MESSTPIHLIPKNAQTEVDDYILFWKNMTKKGIYIPNSVLLIGDTIEQAAFVANELAQRLCKEELFSETETCNYETLIKVNILNQYKSNINTILISTPSDISDFEIFKSRISFFYEHPENLLIICCTIDNLSLFNSDEHLYWDLLPKKIKLTNSSIHDIIYNKFISLLEGKLQEANNDADAQIIITEEFRTGIKNYISVIYDEARMKDDLFITDLFNRVMRNVYYKADTNFVDENDIPYSAKYIEKFKSEEESVNDEVPASENKAVAESAKNSSVEKHPSDEAILKAEKSFKNITDRTFKKWNNNKGKSENVILIAMSTLNRPSPNFYLDPDVKGNTNEGWFGISQLEAGSKYFITKLVKNDTIVDRIVIMHSDECEAPIPKGSDLHRFIYDKEPQEIPEYNAITFYRARIEKYINTTSETDYSITTFQNTAYNAIIKSKNNSPEIAPETLNYIRFPSKPTYPKIDFIPVNTSESPTSFIEVADYIRSKNPSTKVNLYIDTQGGGRSDIAMITAIVNLLNNQNVTVKGMIATQYQPQEFVHSLKNVVPDYKKYELMSAMQIYNNYGRANELVKYFDDEKYTQLEKDFTKAVQDASDAIQCCDIDTFDTAIDRIKEASDKYNESEQKSELKLVIEKITEDFNSILKAKYRYVAQIRWCLNKDYIQQALTILEAKMPYEYVSSGLYYFSKKGVLGDSFDEIKERFKNILTKLYPGETVEGKKFISHKDAYKLNDLCHYFINYYSNDEKKLPKDPVSGEVDANFRISKYYKNFSPVTGQTYSNSDQPSINAIKRNISTYMDLKTERNGINHASSNPRDLRWKNYITNQPGVSNPFTSNSNTTPLEDLKKKIENYLFDFERLASSNSARDNVDLYGSN